MATDSDIEGEFIAAAVEAFKLEFRAAIQQMMASGSPSSFTDAERELHRVTRAVANRVTEQVVQAISDDPARREVASLRIAEKAAARSIKVRKERDRETDVRTLE